MAARGRQRSCLQWVIRRHPAGAGAGPLCASSGQFLQRYETARSMGYRGPAVGLLNPETNLRFGGALFGVITVGIVYYFSGKACRRH
jgi:hypothetical protein